MVGIFLFKSRYLCSCRQASRRAWSTKKVLRNAIIVISVGTLLIEWPFLLYSKITINPVTGAKACTVQSSTLLQFHVTTYLDCPPSGHDIYFYCCLDIRTSTTHVRCTTCDCLEFICLLDNTQHSDNETNRESAGTTNDSNAAITDNCRFHLLNTDRHI